MPDPQLAQRTLDAAPDAVISIDSEDRVVQWNLAAERLFGWSAGEALGRPLADLIVPPEYREAHRRGVQRAARAGGSSVLKHRLELEAQDHAGRRFPVEYSVVAVDDGDHFRCTAFLHDVSERRSMECALRSSEERFHLAVAGSGDGLWDWNLESGEVYTSPRCSELLGYAEGEIALTLEIWKSLLHPADRAAVLAALQEHLERREPYDVEYRLRVRTGEWRWLRARGQALWDAAGRPLRMAGSLGDITRLKGAEDHLRRTAEGLLAAKNELEAHSAELDAARVVAEAANRAKSEFLANMSHEIRTPMAAILGYAELIANPDLAPGERQELGCRILDNGRHLLTILDDILDLSKIEAGRMSVHRSSCSPGDLVWATAELLRPEATRKGLNFQVRVAPDTPRTMLTDPVRFRQILMNLIGNAIKFTEQGQVRVQVGPLPPDGAGAPRIVVGVCDTGIGMDTGQLAALFQTFTQVDTSSTRRFGGTGLGLAISQRLAGMMGGAIRVASVPGEGSTFTLELPLEPTALIDEPAPVRPSAPARAASRPGPQPLEGVRVLLADDGRDNQRIIGFHLRSAGARVEVVGDGLQAVARCLRPGAEPAPDLVLMDMQMPELDGYGATRELRSAGWTRPVIAVTAHAMAGDRERCREAGCSDYLTKPVAAASLIELCVRWAPPGSGPAPAAPRAREPRDVRTDAWAL